MKIKVGDLLDITNGKLFCGDKNVEIKKGYINSKSNMEESGSCFFGIKGKKNGSLYYEEAIKNGAKICVLNDIKKIKQIDDVCIIIVDDSLKALQALAEYKRNKFNGKVIGITGSYGKTTTKEMISNILEEKYKILKTNKNENSKIGVPLTILRLEDEEVMIIEMGISMKDEMNILSKIVKPDISIITNISSSHIENFNEKKDILKEKVKITNYMNKGFLIINNDDEYLRRLKGNIKNNINFITCSIKNKSNVKAYDILEDTNTIFSVYNIKDIKINSPYEYINNALLAIAVARIFNIDEYSIKKGLKKKLLVNHRLEIINLKNNITIIDDSYNANYKSVKLALKVLGKYENRKIAVIGDILELGNKTYEIHQKIINDIILNKVDIIITIGNYTKIIYDYFKDKNIISKHFKDEQKVACYIKKIICDNDTILFKASNKINLVSIVDTLKNDYVDNN